MLSRSNLGRALLRSVPSYSLARPHGTYGNPVTRRAFSTTNLDLQKRRAISLVYSQYGPPEKVLRAHEEDLAALEPSQVEIHFLASPINPADINQIQGTYPVKPVLKEGIGAVGGNEGLAEVTAIGKNVTDLQVGDWVIPSGSGFGTWRTHAICGTKELLTVDRKKGVDPLVAATITVNPCTAFRMLRDFTPLEFGDVVIQNGANSGVGQAVIQLAKAWGYRTVNVVRNRPDFESLAARLKDLGADMVVTEEELRKPETAAQIKSLGPPAKLGLNCVGGKSATNVARLLSQGGSFVTYGGMSKEPVTIPTSLLIFKDITCHGFWMTRWYENHQRNERGAMLDELFRLAREDKLKLPAHDLTSLSSYDIQQFQNEAIDAVRRATTGFTGKKQIMQMGT
ncbi:hypothetical protein DFS34DRAFT_644251 [Phlyctochytrium arcticum]|nr:hypothetical protein DFS34DRAFT_644251 [Phlyctochytrium arcticum]